MNTKITPFTQEFYISTRPPLTFRSSSGEELSHSPRGKKEYIQGNMLFLDGKMTECLQNFLKSAEQGYPAAFLRLGDIYENGRGTEQNLTTAENFYEKVKNNIEWFHAQAAQTKSDANYNLALCYSKGIGVKQDNIIAFKYYKEAAEQGHIFARKAVDSWNIESTKNELPDPYAPIFTEISHSSITQPVLGEDIPSMKTPHKTK